MNNLLAIFADEDKMLIGIILMLLMRENADKGLILALVYVLFS